MRTYLVALIFFAGLWSINALSYEDYTKINSTDAVTEIRQFNLLTPKQKELVDLFRKQNSKYLTDDYLRSDGHIVGLLQVSKWDLGNAGRYFKKVLSWRLKNKLEDIGAKGPDPDMLERFPFRFKGTTYDGCPILEIDWGKWYIAEYLLSKEFIRDGVNSYNLHQLSFWESARKETKNLSPKCDHAILLADIGGFSMKSLASPNGVGSVIRMATTLETYYHNLFTNIICFNSPPDFLTLMTILQPYMGSTADIFSIYSDNERDVASRHVLGLAHPQQLSPHFAKYFTTKQ